jgi:deoxyadenosine/deoxycytidine kinase
MMFVILQRFKITKDEWQRFSVVMQVICDPSLLLKVLSVYDLEAKDAMREVNISYYQSLFDRTWAESMHTVENEFWDNVTAFFYSQSDKVTQEM